MDINNLSIDEYKKHLKTLTDFTESLTIYFVNVTQDICDGNVENFDKDIFLKNLLSYNKSILSIINIHEKIKNKNNDYYHGNDYNDAEIED